MSVPIYLRRTSSRHWYLGTAAGSLFNKPTDQSVKLYHLKTPKIIPTSDVDTFKHDKKKYDLLITFLARQSSWFGSFF